MRTASGQRESSEEIERDIARTRADMDETVSEIQRRLSPEHLRREAKHAVQNTFRDTAQGARKHMFDTIKENPVPSVLAGLSIGWLVAKGSSSSSSDRDRYDRDRYVRAYERDPYYAEQRYAEPRGGAYRQAEYYDEPGTYPDYDEAGTYYEDDDEGRSASERAGDAASGAQDTAKRYGREAQQTAQRYGREARRGARRAANRTEELMEDNPLAVGAATLALGAFAGLLLPGTRKEDEWMGETRDRVVHQAQSAAKETAERAQHVAEKTAEDAKETAKEEAKKEKEKEKSDRTS